MCHAVKKTAMLRFLAQRRKKGHKKRNNAFFNKNKSIGETVSLLKNLYLMCKLSKEKAGYVCIQGAPGIIGNYRILFNIGDQGKVTTVYPVYEDKCKPAKKMIYDEKKGTCK